MERSYRIFGTNASTIAYMRTKRSEIRNPAFGSWLRSAIVARGMTQNQFASAIGASKSSVSRWVHGDAPKGEFIEKIADVLVLDYDLVATKAGYRPSELLDDPTGKAEEELLPLIRKIEWSEVTLGQVKRQLDFLLEYQSGRPREGR